MKKKRGFDLAEKRLDVLSKSFFSFLLKQNAGQIVLDLGCGSGWVGIAAAFLHHKVFMYDIEDNFDLSKKVDFLTNEFYTKILFQVKDLTKITANMFPKKVDLVYIGSVLHYFKYKDAKKILKIIRNKLKKGGRIFVSVSGIDTELGVGYKKSCPINNRFFLVSEKNMKRFFITEPVTLYKKREFIDLFENLDFKVIEIKKTAFGNFKAVFEKL